MNHKILVFVLLFANAVFAGKKDALIIAQSPSERDEVFNKYTSLKDAALNPYERPVIALANSGFTANTLLKGEVLLGFGTQFEEEVLPLFYGLTDNITIELGPGWLLNNPQWIFFGTNIRFLKKENFSSSLYLVYKNPINSSAEYYYREQYNGSLNVSYSVSDRIGIHANIGAGKDQNIGFSHDLNSFGVGLHYFIFDGICLMLDKSLKSYKGQDIFSYLGTPITLISTETKDTNMVAIQFFLIKHISILLGSGVEYETTKREPYQTPLPPELEGTSPPFRYPASTFEICARWGGRK